MYLTLIFIIFTHPHNMEREIQTSDTCFIKLVLKNWRLELLCRMNNIQKKLFFFLT
jgi:hypothetical protein